jgi:hypothetical protein
MTGQPSSTYRWISSPQGFEVVPCGVGVTQDGGAARAAQKFVNGHTGFLALDVPQSHVDATHCGVEDEAVAPVAAAVDALPDVLDVACFASDKAGADYFLCCDDDGGGVVDLGYGVGALKAGLVCGYFDDGPDATDVFYFYIHFFFVLCYRFC